MRQLSTNFPNVCARMSGIASSLSMKAFKELVISKKAADCSSYAISRLRFWACELVEGSDSVNSTGDGNGVDESDLGEANGVEKTDLADGNVVNERGTGDNCDDVVTSSMSSTVSHGVKSTSSGSNEKFERCLNIMQ